jgi:hypothetical protein
MNRTQTRTSGWLAAIVIVHLVISLIHGAAHSGAAVFLSPAGNLFVWVVILAGPLAGLILQRMAGAVGAWIVALTMAGACVFGVINHFVIQSADHVAHVVGPWSATFALTAGLLALTEAAGAGVGVWSALQGRRTS